VPLPAGPDRVAHAIRSLRGAPVLLGGRGGAPADVAAAARLASRIGELLVERSLAAVECNPVLVAPAGQGAVAVDATVRQREPRG
jgi:acetate---CoA ligase (ADP-forming)